MIPEGLIEAIDEADLDATAGALPVVCAALPNFTIPCWHRITYQSSCFDACK